MYFTKLVRLRRIEEFDWNLLASYEWLVIVHLADLATRAMPTTLHAISARAGQSRDALFVFCDDDPAAQQVRLLERIGAILPGEIDEERPFILLIPTQVFQRADDTIEFDLQHLDPTTPNPDDTLLDAFDEMMVRLHQEERTANTITHGKAALRVILASVWQWVAAKAQDYIG